MSDSDTDFNAALDSAQVAQNGSGSGNEDNLIAGNAAASDPDGASFVFALAGANGGAAHGMVSMDAAGRNTYTLAANFNGPDSFSFNPTDNGLATSNTASISITVNPVNDAPAGSDKTVTTVEATAYAFAAADFCFTDPNDAGDSSGVNAFRAVPIATLPGSGTLRDNGVAIAAGSFVLVSHINAGQFTYTPGANASGNAIARFTVQVQDDGGTANGGVGLGQSPNTITINATPVNDAPVFANFGTAHISATEQTFARLNAGATVSDVDLDALNGGAGNYAGASLIIGPTVAANPEDTFGFGGPGMTFTVDTVNHVLLSSGGQQFATYPIPGSGALAGTIAVNFNSLNTPVTTALANNVLQHITYQNLSDTPPASVTIHCTFNDGNFGGLQGSGGNLTATANRIVDITAVNDAPVAQNGSANGNEDNVINGTLIAADVDSASLIFSRVSNASNGEVTVNSEGTFSDTPNSNFNGSDSFTFKANDGSLDSNVATVSFTVNPVNDAPVITSNGGGDSATVPVLERTTTVTTVVATDVDGPSLSYSIVGGSDAAKFTIDGSSGALSFVTAPNFDVPIDADHNNSHLVQVRASDGSLSDDQSITVQVTDDPGVTSTVHWVRSVDIPPHPPGFLPNGTGDFNADGSSDLAWYNAATNTIDIWMLSNGTWAASSTVGSHPAGYEPVSFGDFNGDATSDLAWYNSTTGSIDIWKLSNGQWAGSADVGSHPAGYQPAGFGDFNNDGTSDLLWYNAATRDAEIWMIANGQWAGSVDVGLHPAGYTPALNGDGTSDIAWFNAATGAVDIWNISNGQWAGSVDVGAHPLGWQPLGAADFNLDGTSDIVWYNPTTNNIDIWLIKNGQWGGSEIINGETITFFTSAGADTFVVAEDSNIKSFGSNPANQLADRVPWEAPHEVGGQHNGSGLSGAPPAIDHYNSLPEPWPFTL